MKSKKKVLPIMITILLFMSFGYTLLDNNITYKVLSFGIIVCALIYLFIKRKIASSSNPVVLSVFTYAIFAGISTLYANSGKFAINEYIKILVAFAVLLCIIIYAKKDKKTLNVVLWCVTTLSFVTAMLTIEGSTLGVISPIIEKFIYGSDVSSYASWGVNRISSIFGNSNVFASMLGVNLMLSLYIYATSANIKLKCVQGIYLITGATSFLLAFSIGGTIALSVATMLMLIMVNKEDKYKFLTLVLEVLLFSGVLVAVMLYLYTSQKSSGSFWPMISIMVVGGVFVYIDMHVGSKIVGFAKKYNKLNKVALIVFFLLALLFVIIAFNTTSSKIIYQNEYFVRTVYPNEYEYSIDIEFENEYSDISVLIYSKNRQEIILSQERIIYNVIYSEYTDMQFVIPEDSEEISIRILNRNDNDIKVNSLNLVGKNENIEVALKYTFIPDNITARLQGLRTNNSLITRLQYFQDSFALFLQSPIIGHGLGGFENAIQSVQKYQYETKYAHNHFFQVMVDMGILGLASYLFLLISCIIALIKSRKINDLAPMLFGALMMIIVHGANEFSMSSGEFLPFAFAVFALIAVTCDVKIKKLEPYNGKILIGTIGAMSLFTVFLAGNIVANININSDSVTLDTLTTNASIDIYEKNDYKLSYVLATSGIDDATMIATSNKYLASLEKAKSNTISLYLAKYYVENFNPEKSYEQIVNYIDYSLYDPDTWNMAFNQYIGALQDASNVEHFYQYKDEYIEIINDLLVKLDKTNESSISKITLDDYSLMYVRNILASEDIETAEEFLAYVDMVIYDSQYDTDVNDNGTYDALNSSYTNFDIKDNTTNSGNRVRIKVPYTYYAMYKIEIESENVSKITIPTDEVAFTVTDEGKTVAFLDTTSSTDGYVDVIINFTGDEAEFGGIKISR